jgi:hypothetical protein
MMDQRQLLKRDIELHFFCLRHTVFPSAQRWILLLMHHAEEHLWEESEMAGDIWNGRWSRQTISSLLSKHSDTLIPPTDYIIAIHWLSNLTLLQMALYSTRRQILCQLDLLSRSNNITLRRPCPDPVAPERKHYFRHGIFATQEPLTRQSDPPPISRPMRFSPAASPTTTDYIGLSWLTPT